MGKLPVEKKLLPVWTIKSQSQGTEKIFIITNFTKSQKLFDCDLGGRYEAVLAHKDDLKCRNESKVITYFQIFGLSRFWYERKTTNLIYQSISRSLKFSAETKKGETKSLVGRNWEIQNWDETMWIAFLEYRTVCIPMQAPKSRKFSSKHFFNKNWEFYRSKKTCSYGWQMKMSLSIKIHHY